MGLATTFAGASTPFLSPPRRAESAGAGAAADFAVAGNVVRVGVAAVPTRKTSAPTTKRIRDRVERLRRDKIAIIGITA